MSRTEKSRHGTHCKRWKDTHRASRSQKRAWAKTKQLRSQAERSRGKAEVTKLTEER